MERSGEPGVGVRHAKERLAEELAKVRGPGSALAFSTWFADAAYQRLLVRACERDLAARRARVRDEAERPAARVLALGPRATRVLPDAGTGVPDVVLADDAATPRPPGVPAALLADHPRLAVPAFDPLRWNPVDGADARCRGDRTWLQADVPEPVRAGHLARLAARGEPLWLARADDRSGRLGELLGPDLYACLREHPYGLGDMERGLHSVRGRRAAHRDHSVPARVRQIRKAAGLPAGTESRVSVLLVTRRPAFLRHALDSVSRQNHADLELVLTLHGSGFDDAVVAQELGRLAVPVQVVRVAGERSLGEALNAASAAANGPWLAKMDDDDVYGADHIADLVQARLYSGADLVGKGIRTVYLAAAGRTLARTCEHGERYFRPVAGATMLVGRAELRRFGPWRDVRSRVDDLLARDVMRGGGLVYRMHGAGFVNVRHGRGHTWAAPDAFFERDADIVRHGWRPELAGMPEARLPPLG